MIAVMRQIQKMDFVLLCTVNSVGVDNVAILLKWLKLEIGCLEQVVGLLKDAKSVFLKVSGALNNN